jgi:cell division protein FtsB
MLERVFQAILDRLRVYSSYALIGLIVLLIVSLGRNITKTIDVQKRIEKKQKEIEKLEDRNVELKQELEILTSNEYAEKQLRDKLGLAKEGEYVVILPEEDILRKLVPEKKEEQESLPDPIWKKWFDLFFES